MVNAENTDLSYASLHASFGPFYLFFLSTVMQLEIILKIIMQLLLCWPPWWLLKSCFTVSPHIQFHLEQSLQFESEVLLLFHLIWHD